MRYVYAEGSRNCWSERDWEEETIAAGPSEKKKNFFILCKWQDRGGRRAEVEKWETTL
jgi:hypothetical protein